MRFVRPQGRRMRFFGTGPPRRRAAAWPGERERRSGADTLRNARAISSSERASGRKAVSRRTGFPSADAEPASTLLAGTSIWIRMQPAASGAGALRTAGVPVGGPPFLSPEFRKIAAGTGLLPDIFGGRRTAYPAVVPEPGFSDDAAGSPVRRAVVGGYGCPERERGRCLRRAGMHRTCVLRSFGIRPGPARKMMRSRNRRLRIRFYTRSLPAYLLRTTYRNTGELGSFPE